MESHLYNKSNTIVENFIVLKEKAQGMSILIVEDDPLNRKEYIKLFGKIFDDIETQNNGLEGLNSYRDKGHDLVVTDVLMPIMDGLEMVGHIKKSNPTQPILLISGHKDKEILYRSIQLAICGYIFKPLDVVQMLDTLNRMISRIYMEKENNLYKDNLEGLVEKKSTEALQIYTVDRVTHLHSLAKLQEDLNDDTYNSLAVLKIKNFKTLNDFHGYEIGNTILKQTADIAKQVISENPRIKLYRISGSHFALLSPTLGKSLQGFVEAIINIFESCELDVNGNLMYFEMNGAIVCRKDGMSLSNVDIALRASEEQEKVLIYENDDLLSNARLQKLKCSDSIKRGLLENRFVPFYQGIVDNKTKTIKKYEALARLIMTNGDIISPADFLPTSKQTKTYNKITMVIIQKALEDFRDSECSLSLNLSIDDINHKRTREFIFEQIALFPEPSRLVFELLESENIGAYVQVKTFFSKLQAFGCKVAIDDFGSGYSNFEHIAKLDLDYIKIDGSLVVGVETEPASRIIIEMLCEFSKKMDIKTIAEYVSTLGISNIVNSIGINESQGYLFSQPSPYNDLMQKIQKI